MDAHILEANDPYCLRPGEAEALLIGSPWRRLLVMGDSIAAGLGDPVDGYLDRSWADRLAAALSAVAPAPAPGAVGSEPAYLNLGRVGARVADLGQQLNRALAFGPDLAVVTAGANDTLRRSFPAADVEAELARVLGALRAAGALVVTMGCFDLGRTSFWPAEQRAELSVRLFTLGALTEKLTCRLGGVHADFLRHPALSDGLFSGDRIHINRRGHAIVATGVIRSLARHRTELAARERATPVGG